jgi:drug/metabolite transporter (DMT)-like permease
MMGYTICYAALWACVRYLSEDIHPVVLVFFRTFFGLLTTLPILMKIKLPALSSGLYPLYILRGLSNIASVAGSYFAIRLLPLADVVAFSYAAPIFATILAAFFLKEHIGRHRILAILFAFGGVLILIRPGFQNLNEGMWIALGSAACFAVTLICVKSLTRHDSPSMVSLMGFVVALACYLHLRPVLLAMAHRRTMGHSGSDGGFCHGLSLVPGPRSVQSRPERRYADRFFPDYICRHTGHHPVRRPFERLDLSGRRCHSGQRRLCYPPGT